MTEYLLIYDRLLSNEEFDRITKSLGASTSKRITASHPLADPLYAVFEFLDIIGHRYTSDFVEVASDKPATFLLLNPSTQPDAVLGMDQEFLPLINVLASLIERFWDLQANVNTLTDCLSSYQYAFYDCFKDRSPLDNETTFDEMEQHILDEQDRLKSEVITALKPYRIK